MSKILITGIAVLDVINHLDHYPQEDEEVRASTQEMRRGGNASNTATVLSQLGHQCELACTLADDMPGQFILQDIKNNSITFNQQFVVKDSSTPTSYITLNTSNGSRSIVHFRDLEELTSQQFDQLELSDIDWCHFEGRNTHETLKMMHKAKQTNIPISLEAEKIRPDIDQLFSLAQVIMISRPFALARNFASAEDCLSWFSNHYPDAMITCTWGNQGAYAIGNGQLIYQPVFPVDPIIDTIGAGDTFNAGLIHYLVQQKPLKTTLEFACKLAAKKCSQYGFQQLGTMHD